MVAALWCGAHGLRWIPGRLALFCILRFGSSRLVACFIEHELWGGLISRSFRLRQSGSSAVV